MQASTDASCETAEGGQLSHSSSVDSIISWSFVEVFEGVSKASGFRVTLITFATSEEAMANSKKCLPTKPVVPVMRIVAMLYADERVDGDQQILSRSYASLSCIAMPSIHS